MSRKIEVEIVADAIGFQRGLRSASSETESFGSKLGGVAKSGMLAFAAGGVVVGEVLKDSVKAAMNAQVAQASLDQALRRTGQSVSGMTPALEEAVGASRKLGFTDDDTTRALAKLEIATGSTKKSVADLSVVQDLARVKHIDLTTASTALATAMTGSQRAAKQLGIVVTPVTANIDKLKASHENLTTAAGKADAAHAKLLDKMATGNAVIAAVTDKVKGQAQAYSETAAGAMARFHAGLESLEVKLGTALLPALGKVAEALGRFIDFLSSSPTVARIAAVAMQVLGDVMHVLVAVGEALLGFYERHRSAALAIVGVLAALTLAFAGPVVAIVALGVALIELYKRSETFRDIVNAVFKSVQDTVNKVMPTIKAIIADGIAAVEALWKEFGATILSYLSATWTNVKTVIQGAFNVIAGYFNLFNDLIHGRWSKLWGDIVQIVSGEWQVVKGLFNQALNTLGTIASIIGKVIWQGIKAGVDLVVSVVKSGISAGVNALRSLAGSALAAAEALGKGIIRGIIDGLAGVGAAFINFAAKIFDELAGIAATVFGAAAHIGSEIVHGIESGVMGLIGGLKSSIEGAIGGMLGSINIPGFSPPAHASAEAIGIPLGKGAIEGWIIGSANLPAKMTETLKNAITAARTAIASARGSFGSAWQQLTNDALAAFDAATARMMNKLETQRGQLTASEQKLADLQASHDEAGRQKAIADAQAALAAAKAGGDPAAIVAAQQQLDDALYNEQVANLEKQAATERAAKDKKYASKEKELQAERDLERRHFEEHLATLEAQLEREGTTHKKAQDRIIRLLKSYGVSYKQAGKDLGEAFARGLQESAGAVEKSAANLAAIVARYLKTSSPSELGAMSDLPTWWRGFAPALVSGLDVKMISGTVSQASTPSGFASTGSSGGGATVNVFASDYTGDVTELALAVRDALKLRGFLNVDVGLA